MGSILFCVGGLVQFPGKVRFYGWPLAGDDAVDACIAQRSIGGDLVVAQYAVKFRAQALYGFAALVVEEMRTQLYADTIKRFKGVREQKQFAFGIQRRALYAFAIPGSADLHAAVGSLNIHVIGHAHYFCGADVPDGEGKQFAFGLKVQPAVDLCAHLFRLRDNGVPELPEFAVLHGFNQVIVMSR